MLQIAMSILTMTRYKQHLRNENTQPNCTAVCRQTIPVDIEVEYFCNNIIRHYSTSVNIKKKCMKSRMELAWKYGRLSSIPFLKSSIPFHSGIFHIPYQNFRPIPFHSIFHSIPYHALDEKLVMQKSRRQPQSSLTIYRFRKRKSCWHVIAISQAGIAAPTLTEMQGFEANKRMFRASPFALLHAVFILRALPIQVFEFRARIEPGYDRWEAHEITTRLRQTHRCNVKMLYLTQMYEKKAIEGYA